MEIYEKLVDLTRKKLFLSTNIIVTDNKSIEIENCKKVLEYNDIYIRLSTSTLILQIWGSDLIISDYKIEGIVIKGNISSIEFLHK